MPTAVADLTIKKLYLQVEALINQMPSSALQGIKKIETQSALAKLRQILQDLNQKIPNEIVSKENAQPLVDLLTAIDALTVDTDLDPTIATQSPFTKVFLGLTELLEDVYEVSRYKLLMPSIEVTVNEATVTDLKDPELKLHHFIRGDNRFIEVFYCLEAAENDGILKHTSLFDKQQKNLSVEAPAGEKQSEKLPHLNSEAGRLIYHSKESEAYYKAIINRINARTEGTSFGAILARFADDLRLGNSGTGLARTLRKQRVEASKPKPVQVALLEVIEDKPIKEKPTGMVFGNEEDAGTLSLNSVITFSDWFQELSAEERATILECSGVYQGRPVTMQQVWDKLTRQWKKDASAEEQHSQNTKFCMNTIGDEIDCILKVNPKLYNLYNKGAKDNKCADDKLIIILEEQLKLRKNLFIEALKDPEYKVLSSYGETLSNINLLHHYAPTIKTVAQFHNCLGELTNKDAQILFSKLDEELQTALASKESFEALGWRCKDKLAELLKDKIPKTITTVDNFISVLEWLPQDMLEPLFERMAPRLGELFKDHYLQFLKAITIAQNRSVAISLLENLSKYLPEIVTSIEALHEFNVIASFTSKNKMIVSIFDHLPALIKQGNDLRIACRRFEPAPLSKEKNAVILIQKVAAKRDISTLFSSDSLQQFLMDNRPDVNSALVTSLGVNVVTKIDNYDQLVLIFHYMPGAQHLQILQLLTPQQLALIKKNNFHDGFYNLVSADSKTVLIEKIGERLGESCTSLHRFIKFIGFLGDINQSLFIKQCTKRIRVLLDETPLNNLHEDLKELNKQCAATLLGECLDLLPNKIKTGHQWLTLQAYIGDQHQSAFLELFKPRLPELVKCPSVLSALLSQLIAHQISPLIFLKGIEDNLEQIITRSRHFVEVIINGNAEYQALLLDKFKNHLVPFSCTRKRLFIMLNALLPENHGRLMSVLIANDSLAAAVPAPEDLIRLLRNVTDINTRWDVFQYFLKKSPQLRSYIETTRHYYDLLELCAEEHHHEFIKATSNTLLGIVKTPLDLEFIQIPLSSSSLVQLFTLFTPQKMAAIYRPESPKDGIALDNNTAKLPVTEVAPQPEESIAVPTTDSKKKTGIFSKHGLSSFFHSDKKPGKSSREKSKAEAPALESKKQSEKLLSGSVRKEKQTIPLGDDVPSSAVMPRS